MKNELWGIWLSEQAVQGVALAHAPDSVTSKFITGEAGAAVRIKP
jgi:hypothetical protein